MDNSIKEQIFNILKKNSIDVNKITFVELSKTIYKIYYSGVFATYIEITNNNNNNNKAINQNLNWRCFRDKFVDYIKKLDKFNFDVVCLVEIVDTKMLDKCMTSLKTQTNEPYIILIVCSHSEKQFAIDHNVDFFWSTDKNMYSRLSDAIASIRGKIRFVKNVMICYSNDIFFNNWIQEGVKLIQTKECDIAGSDKQYLVDIEKNTYYKRVIDQDYAKQLISFFPWTNIFWHNGLIMNKVILNKINWVLYSQQFMNNITFGLFDKFLKTNAKLGVIIASEIVSIFSEKSTININDYIMNRGNKIDQIQELPILNKPPFSEFGLNIKKIANRKVIPKLRELSTVGRELSTVGRELSTVGRELSEKTPEKTPEKNLPKTYNKITKNMSDGQIELQRKELKRQAQQYQQQLLLIKKDIEIKVPMIILPKKEVIMLQKGDKIVIPGEKIQKPDIEVPIIMLKDIEKQKLLYSKKIAKHGDKVVIPTEKSIKENAEIPIIINKELLVNGKLVKNLSMNLNSIDIETKTQFEYISPNKIITIIILNNYNTNNSDYYLSQCIKYLEEQTLCTDIILLLNNSAQRILCEKFKKPYYLYDISNEYIRIQNVIKQIRKFNPNYIMFIDDSCLISKNWVESCYNKINSGSCDIVGSSTLNVINDSNKYVIEFIQDNLNFISKHFRPNWCFFYGRLMNNKLLNSLSWNLFSNNYDVNIEVSLGVKLQSVSARLGKIDNAIILSFITDNQLKTFNATNYYKIWNPNNSAFKNMHDAFEDTIGEYKEAQGSRAPLIQRKNTQLINISNSAYSKTFHHTNTNYGVEISIVLPTWNGFPKIKQAVDNVRNQNFKDYELLIINDGSTQAELINYLEEIKHERKIRIIHLNKNGGLPNALNTGIKYSRGKFWTWISDDNIISENFLLKLKQKLDQGYGFVYSNYVLVDTLMSVDSSIQTINMDILYNNVTDIIDSWRGMPSYMWRKELINQIGYFDINIQGCEDYEYVVKTFICAGDSVAHINDYLFTYYKQKNTLTTRLANIIPTLGIQTRDKYRSIATHLRELHHQIYISNKDPIIYISDKDHTHFYGRSRHMISNLIKYYTCFYVTTNSQINIEKYNNVWYVNKNIFDIYVNNFNITTKNPIIYFTDPKFHNYKKLMLPQCTIFDFVNDNTYNNTCNNSDTKVLLESTNKADVVLYSSNYLGDIIKHINPDCNAHYINNACDYKYFMNTKTPLLKKPSDLIKSNGRPIIGYYGKVDDRLDFELIKLIADIETVHVVIIGVIDISLIQVTPITLITHPNITWINHVEYSRIPYYLSWFDICMIPFKNTDQFRGSNPLKFYEYCSSGKIIIGSIFDDINIFYYKIDSLNCVTTITNILKNCDIKARNDTYIKFAQHNGWTNRVSELLDIIKIDYTIIYPPLIHSDFLMQRPTQLIKGFSKINKIRSIFIENTYETTEHKNYKHMILNKTTFETSIKQYIKGEIVLYYTYPDDIKFKKILEPNYVIYDLIDNPTDEFKSWDNLNLGKSMKEADCFICSAPIMYEKYKHMNQNTMLISNACEYHHFDPATKKLIKPKNFPNISKDKKVIGYYGAHSTWLDLELIKKIANYDVDKYTVVMVGKSNKNDDYNESFVHSNITWIEHQSYYDLPKYLSHFDICMIPFKLTTMMKGCDPMKFYEYLAAGKPIITTKIEPILKFKDVCYFMDSNNYGQIIDLAAGSLNNKSLIEKRKNIAIKYSWDHQAKEILRLLLSKDITTTIIYPQFIRWNKMFQRPQQMITALSKKPHIRCVFVDFTITEVQIKNNTLIIVPSYEIAKRYIKGKVILYYNHTSIAKNLKNYTYDHCVFELVDNPVDEFADWQTDLDLAIRNANSLSITANCLAQYMTKHSRDYSLVPNGTDYHHFEKAQNRLKKPVDMPIISGDKTIIGYYGAHAPWVDWSIVKKIADLSFVHIVMIGRMDKPPYNMKFTHKNITWLPIKDYTELPNYLSWFDICLIPFKLTEMIKGCDPIKFYEYSSAGKPVIATKMVELEKFSNVCYFINETNYETVIKKAIKELDNYELRYKRQEIAKNNTWDKRADDFLKMIPF